jgi:hypothetical protein
MFAYELNIIVENSSFLGKCWTFIYAFAGIYKIQVILHGHKHIYIKVFLRVALRTFLSTVQLLILRYHLKVDVGNNSSTIHLVYVLQPRC